MEQGPSAGMGPGRARSLLAAGLFLLALGCLGTAHAVNPDHEWRQIHGGNFEVIYHEDEERIAARALRIAEDVGQRLDRRYHWTPDGPVRIVLANNVEMANGFTLVFPRNLIHIYLTPPTPTDTLQRFDDWLRLVITHEYTHVIQLDMTHGLPETLRGIFGRNMLLFPGQFQPALLQEGLAVYEESNPAAGIGRLGSPMFDMQMRGEVTGGLKPWNEVAMDGDSHWPDGNIPYLYGSYFYQFVSEQAGDGTLPQLVNNYSYNFVPFLVSHNLSVTTDKSRATWWGKFDDWLEARFGAAPYPAGTPLTHGTQLTQLGFDTQSVRAAADGRIFFVRDDHRRHPALMVRQADGRVRELAPLFAPATIDFNPHAGVLVSRPEICDEYDLDFDLYRVDPLTGDAHRLTRCGRYRYATWSGDGQRIAAVKTRLGVSSLVLLDGDGQHPETVWTGHAGEVVGGLDWSPTADTVAAAVWRPTRGWALETFDLARRTWKTLTDSAGAVADPQYTPDGRTLLFTSDAGGVYNLRKLTLADGRVTTLTHVTTGAFSPSLVQAGSGSAIAYLGYTSHGYDVFRLASEQTLDESLKAQKTPPLPAPTPPPEKAPASHPYHPWRSMVPDYWFPELQAGPGFAQVGASTSGTDALGLHGYAADLNYEVQHRLVGGSLYYQYADRFTLGAERVFRFDTDGNKLARVRRQDRAQMVFARPLPSLEQTWTPMVGVATERARDVVIDTLTTPDTVETVAGVALDWDSTQRWPISVSTSQGQNLLLVAESSRHFAGDYQGDAFRLDWQGYLPLSGERVLNAHYREGYARAGARPFNLGSALGPDLSPFGRSRVFNRRDFALRGYGSGLAELTGQRMRALDLELRLPLVRPERAFTAVPIGLHQVSLRPFVDAGGAWDRGTKPSRYYSAAGVEAIFDLNFFYRFNLQLRLGVAHGFAAIGDTQGYVQLNLPI
ncbi:MAG: hypothetical protein PVJ40_01600 [Gammaproteobacteria bacterium]